MRIEYEIFQRLVWDNEFRRQFEEGRERAIRENYPQYKGNAFFVKTALIGGLEEEAYRRLASLYRTSKDIFPLSHNLLIAFYGNELFESALTQYIQEWSANSKKETTQEVLDPLDGSIVGPLVINVVEGWKEERTWLLEALKYEWAVWHARRVANGWPAISNTTLLVEGASLVDAAIDLKALLSEVERLEGAHVAPEVYAWRIKPAEGAYYGAVFPKSGNVMEARLDEKTYLLLQDLVSKKSKKMRRDIGLVFENMGLIRSE